MRCHHHQKSLDQESLAPVTADQCRERQVVLLGVRHDDVPQLPG
jgi:hypothetical protein